MTDGNGHRGRPATPQDEAAARRERWRRAVAFSGLTAKQTAALIGKSLATVWSYGSAKGTVPTPAAIAALEAYNVRRASEEMERLRRG